MANILCAKTEIKMFDSVIDEKVTLWENPDPTSNFTDSESTRYPLPFEDYDSIIIIFRTVSWDSFRTSADSVKLNRLSEIQIDCEDILRKSNYSDFTNFPRYGFGFRGESYTYNRQVYIDKSSDYKLQIHFTNCYRFGTSKEPTKTYNQYLVPLKIVGVKKSKKILRGREYVTFLIPGNNWSTSTKIFMDKPCYWQRLPISYTDEIAPIVSISSSQSNEISLEEQNNYSLLDYIVVNNDDSSNKFLELYAKTKPTSDFSILVMGVK